MFKDGFFDDWRAIFVIDDRKRNAPGSLARNAPIGPIFDHIDHLLFAPSGFPMDLVNRFEKFVADRFNRTEPLRSRPENDGLMRPPIVRI